MASRPKGTGGDIRGRGALLRAKALQLRTQGTTHAEIARQLGVARQTVTGWLSEPQAAEVLASTRAKALLQAEAAAEPIMSALVKIALDVSEDTGDRISAGKAVLDRCGVVPGQRVEVSGGVTGTPLAVLEARVRARLLGAEPEPDAGDSD